MSEAERRCGTCRLYDVARVKNKAGRIRADRVALCNWALDVPLPDSVRREYRIIHTHYMSPKDGTTCPTWEPRHD